MVAVQVNLDSQEIQARIANSQALRDAVDRLAEKPAECEIMEREGIRPHGQPQEKSVQLGN